MEERDSLDGLIDDIDFENLPQNTGKDTNKTQGSTINMNDILDEVSNTFFEDSFSEEKHSSNNDGDDDLFPHTNLNDHVQLSFKRELESSLYGVPIHLRKKWIDLLTKDLKPPNISRLGHSAAYSSWNTPHSSYTIDKSLRDVIMKASSKCTCTAQEVQILEEQLIGNSQNKMKYIEHLIKENKEKILQDCNYNSTKYPELHKMLHR